jgi:predicted dehydrogenase
LNQKTIGFAIVGAGMIADYHRRAIEANADKGAKLVAVGHYEPARFDEIAVRFGVPCEDYDTLLSRPEVEVVCICTPSGHHADQAIAAVRAGKHVLVEKPMALSLADADLMIETSRAHGVQLGVVLQRRAEPLFRQIKQALANGDLGDLTQAVVTMPYYRGDAYYAQADWRGTWALDGGGVLMNQGIHIIDLLVWMMGDPVEIQAYAGALHRKVEVEDVAAAALRFANGSLATITATTTAAPGFPHRLEFYGTNGGIQLEGEGVTRWTLADPAKMSIEPPPMQHSADAGAGADPRGIALTGHIAIVRDMIDAVREGHAPRIDGAEGRRSLAAILAIYQAAGLR